MVGLGGLVGAGDLPRGVARRLGVGAMVDSVWIPTGWSFLSSSLDLACFRWFGCVLGSRGLQNIRFGEYCSCEDSNFCTFFLEIFFLRFSSILKTNGSKINRLLSSEQPIMLRFPAPVKPSKVSKAEATPAKGSLVPGKMTPQQSIPSQAQSEVDPLAFSMCHGSDLTFQDYWNLMLHDTPMPSAVRDHLGAVPTAAEESHIDDTEPTVLLHRGNGDTPRVSGVVFGVNGRPVTVDFGHKPVSIYFDNANRKKPEGRHGKVGDVSAAAHYDRDVIDNLRARNFFLEKDLHVGAKLVMVLGRGLSGDTFLHREAADGIPFSSEKTMAILRRFGVQPASPMANKLEETIRRCEEPSSAEERLFCATSFESMVDFVLSSMETNDLETLTTSSVTGDFPPPEQVYTVHSWATVSTPNTTATACHVLKYPYTILHCHRIPRSRTYVLKMVGEDGTAVEAATICHADTSKWAPTFYVLRAFRLRPGEETICHLMPDGDVAWLPRRGGAGAAAAASL